MKTGRVFAAGLAGISMFTGLVAGAQTPAKVKDKNPDSDIRTERIIVSGQGPDDVISVGGIGSGGGVGQGVGVGRGIGPSSGGTMVFLSNEFGFDGKVVKNAPYSAEAITETTQTLSDGNRIVRRSTAMVYRDTEGRTRRDQSMVAIGPYASAGDLPQTTVISDPVAGLSYIMDSRSKTARKNVIRPNSEFRFFTAPAAPPRPATPATPGTPAVAPAPAAAPVPPAPPSDDDVVTMVAPRVAIAPGSPEDGSTHVDVKTKVRVEENVVTYMRQGGETGNMMYKIGPDSARQPKVEKLGTQNVEGVMAEGTRITMTIPAGEIGNERPIQIVNESWYSSELQTVVLSKNLDPMTGDVVYRLSNINRNEPVRSLFDVPGDYKVKEGPGFQTFEWKRAPKSED